MTNKELIQALNEADMKAIDEGTKYYDLKELYEAVTLTAQEKADLAKKVQDAKSDEDYAAIQGYLAGKFEKKPGVAEAFEDKFEFNEDGSIDYESKEKDESLEESFDPEFEGACERVINSYLKNHPYTDTSIYDDEEDLAAELCDNVFNKDYFDQKTRGEISHECYVAACNIFDNCEEQVEIDAEEIEEGLMKINESEEMQAAHELAKSAAKNLYFQKWKAQELIDRNPRIVKDFLKSGLTADEYFQKQVDYYGLKQYTDWMANGMKERYPNEYEAPKRTFKFEAYNPEIDKADNVVDFLLERIDKAKDNEELAAIYDLVVIDEDHLSEANYTRLLDAIEYKLETLE